MQIPFMLACNRGADHVNGSLDNANRLQSSVSGLFRVKVLMKRR